jgi:sulfur-oxidizing protein SoxX
LGPAAQQGNVAAAQQLQVLRQLQARLNAAQLRLRMVDSRLINPESFMPAYFRIDHLNRVAPAFQGKTLLSAQDIEDVVAYLLSLKD